MPPVPALPDPGHLAQVFRADPAALAEFLGVDVNDFLESEWMPPVEPRRIAGWLDGVLHPLDAADVLGLIQCYRAWFDGLIVELVRRHG